MTTSMKYNENTEQEWVSVIHEVLIEALWGKYTLCFL